MAELTPEAFEAALTRHTSSTDEVYPSAIGLIAAEADRSGRLWEMARLVMAGQETMRFLAGGNRPGEVAARVARWADTRLELDDLKMVLASGAYDPEPFEALADAGLLHDARRCRLCPGSRCSPDHNGTVHGAGGRSPTGPRWTGFLSYRRHLRGGYQRPSRRWNHRNR